MHGTALLCLVAVVIATSGCVAGEPTQSTTAPTTSSVVDKLGNGTEPVTTFFLLFPPECALGALGGTTYNSTKAEFEQSCGRSLTDQITSPGPCATFEFHDKSFRVRAGENVTAEIVISFFTDDESTPRIVLRDAAGEIAQSTSEPQRIVTPTVGRASFTAVAQNGGAAPIALDIYVDGGLCQGVWTGGSRESWISFSSV